MVKRKGKRRKNIPQKKIFIPSEETSSSPLLNPNATLAPDSSPEILPSGQLLSRDSTNAPKIGEELEEEGHYAGSHAALIDKYVLSKQNIPPFILVIMVIGFIGYIFIQDNAAGKLADWQGVLWAFQKSVSLSILFLFILFCLFLYKKIFGK